MTIAAYMLLSTIHTNDGMELLNDGCEPAHMSLCDLSPRVRTEDVVTQDANLDLMNLEFSCHKS